MIKNVVFDIGQVLKGWHPNINAIYPEEIGKVVYDAIWRTGYWEQMDIGIEEDEALFEKMIATAPDYEEQIRYTLAHLSVISERKSYAIPWVDELKERGYNVYYLSNYSRHLRKTVPETIDFIPHMDGGVFSCDVNLLKPDRRIYEVLCQKYDLDPAECLFIDDRQENVDAAIDYGMHAICFRTYDETYPEVMCYIQEDKRGSM